MSAKENLLGWYHIDETWNLYVDAEDPIDESHRVLRAVHVDFICVDEPPEDAPTDAPYHVDHYGRDGTLITSLRLDAEDIEPELRDRETTDRPWHL